MANAAGEGMATQNYAKPENGWLQPAGGSTTDPYLIDDLIFEALQENPNPDSEIQKAVKLVENMDEDIFEITEKLNKRQLDERRAYSQLCFYEEREKYCFRAGLTIKAEKMASLKRDLDKLTFANNAYKGRAIKTEENIINFHNLSFVMHHGSKNMATEKKLLKEVNASLKKLPDYTDSDHSVVEKITFRIWGLQHCIDKNRFITEPAMKIDEKQALKEISELEWAKEKAFANASVNGKIWNSLSSKNVIKQQIKLMEEASFQSDEERREYLQLIADIKEVKREINVVKKDICSLKKQLLDVRRKKQKAYKAVLKLIKIGELSLFI